MSAPKFTFAQFKTRFPDDDACLAYIFNKRYADATECPKCEGAFKYHQCKGTRYYACQHCGHHIHPTVGTIFEGSKSPLVSWLFAMFLFANSRNGVSAKELQRQLGVAYNTAWKIGHLIRGLMDDQGAIVLDGVVEMDETLMGGRKRGGKRGWGADKPCVFGMVERGGKVFAQVVPDRKGKTLMPIITQHTTEEVVAHTDDFSVYRKLHHEVAEHHVIQHSKGFYVHEDVHTQTIDGHWSLLKRSIKGTHTSVSVKYLQNYLNEFSFRRNHKSMVLFDAILSRV